MSKASLALFLALMATEGSIASGMPLRDHRVTFTSYGPAKIGMSQRELAAALGVAVKDEYPDTNEGSCKYVAATRGYEGVSFMLIDERLVRIDIESKSIMTLSGARIGDDQKTVESLYQGRVEVTPHAYTDPDGKYLTLLSRDKKYGIRFETDHGKVITYYAGTAESIRYIEGCL